MKFNKKLKSEGKYEKTTLRKSKRKILKIYIKILDKLQK